MIPTPSVAFPVIVAHEVAKRIAGDIYESAKGAMSKVFNSQRAEFEMGFSEYLKINIDRCDTVKTIINRHQPVKLREIYEDLNLRILDEHGDESFRLESEVIEEVFPRKAVITGTAGSGKSFFMKRLFLRVCENDRRLMPFFIELRQLNSIESPNIIDVISSQLSAHVRFFSSNFLTEIMKKCNVILLLDGYDELESKVKNSIFQQIDKLTYDYQSLRIIVSSRPDDYFSSWSDFYEYSICNMNKSQCLSMIQKAKHPSDLKDRFYQNVDREVYETHKEYLKNPLMTYVMLLTSDQFVDFPSDISDFYKKAFETLYSGHDVLKAGGYQREVKCNLRMKELESLMGYFCALSFYDQKYEYNNDSIHLYIEKSIKINGFQLHSDDVVEDLVKNYCMIIKDGNSYSFIHRTFQEYFSAVCLSSSEYIDYLEYNTQIVSKEMMECQRYISMLINIGPERFFTKYFMPTLRVFLGELYPIRKKNPKAFLGFFMEAYSIDTGGNVSLIHLGREGWGGFVSKVLNLIDKNRYGNRFAVVEDIDEVKHMLADERNGLADINFKAQKLTEIRKLKMYKLYLTIVENSKEHLSELERKSVQLRRLAN